MAFSYNTNEHLVRRDLWSPKLKENFEDRLIATKYVDWMTDFPDGDTLHIPSIGQAVVHNFAEGQKVIYNSMDTGEFTFSITDYLQSGMFITERMKQDSFYAGRLVSSFVPKMQRAIGKRMEADILAIGPSGQTSGNANAINGMAHRWVASGTNEVIALEDFAKANLSLDMANVPHEGRIAIVHPSVGYTIDTLSNITSVSNNPRFEGIVTTGMTDGMQFIRNIYGFDVYTSQNLARSNETIGSKTAGAGVCNLFFCAQGEASPFVGAVRQAPKVDSEYNKDEQREEYVVTCRYGLGFYRPESLCVVISDTDQVTF